MENAHLVAYVFAVDMVTEALQDVPWLPPREVEEIRLRVPTVFTKAIESTIRYFRSIFQNLKITFEGNEPYLNDPQLFATIFYDNAVPLLGNTESASFYVFCSYVTYVCIALKEINRLELIPVVLTATVHMLNDYEDWLNPEMWEKCMKQAKCYEETLHCSSNSGQFKSYLARTMDNIFRNRQDKFKINTHSLAYLSNQSANSSSVQIPYNCVLPPAFLPRPNYALCPELVRRKSPSIIENLPIALPIEEYKTESHGVSQDRNVQQKTFKIEETFTNCPAAPVFVSTSFNLQSDNNSSDLPVLHPYQEDIPISDYSKNEFPPLLEKYSISPEKQIDVTAKSEASMAEKVLDKTFVREGNTTNIPINPISTNTSVCKQKQEEFSVPKVLSQSYKSVFSHNLQKIKFDPLFENIVIPTEKDDNKVGTLQDSKTKHVPETSHRTVASSLVCLEKHFESKEIDHDSDTIGSEYSKTSLEESPAHLQVLEMNLISPFSYSVTPTTYLTSSSSCSEYAKIRFNSIKSNPRSAEICSVSTNIGRELNDTLEVSTRKHEIAEDTSEKPKTAVLKASEVATESEDAKKTSEINNFEPKTSTESSTEAVKAASPETLETPPEATTSFWRPF